MAGREKNCQWHFADQPNSQEIGPNNAMEQNFKQNRYASLVRESIQNSLDAVLDPSKPVVVKYSFLNMKGGDYPEFFKLQHHIKGCLDYFPDNRNAKAIYEPMYKLFKGSRYAENLGYIRVSDYNTKGMAYENNTNNPFYAFVRAAGVTVKDNNTAGGSFGFGKAAYYLLSPINSIIISTCTKDGRKFFEGASSLVTHLHEGKKKMAVGYYDNQGGNPITTDEDIPSQFRRNEPGTDINILGFDTSNLNEAINEITIAVLRNFWMAIYTEKLIVNINDEYYISKDNIDELMENYFEEDDNTRKTNFHNPRPYFDAVRFANTSRDYILYEDNLALLGHVKLYVYKKKGVTDKIYYMRALQMLVYAKRTRTNYGMYGVFYCDSEKGNDYLRYLENPAHNEWKAANWQVNGRTYGMGHSVLQEMENFISECLSQAFSLKEKEAIDIKGLEEFLYIPTAYEEDDDLDSESLVGDTTGDLKDDGSSYTSNIVDDEENPFVSDTSSKTSTGHVLINKTVSATNNTDGNLRSGHGEAERKPKKPGIQKPGDVKEKRKEDEDGEKGLFASPISIPYRTFSQSEFGYIYHYVVLHPDEAVGNIRLHFYAAGEENDEELQIAESNIGNISGNIIRDIHIDERRLCLRVRFSDNMKHAIKLSAEELYEI